MRVFTESEASAFLNTELGVKVSVHMLRRYRHTGLGGPAFVRPFRNVEYREDDLRSWIDARRTNRAASATEARIGLRGAAQAKAAL